MLPRMQKPRLWSQAPYKQSAVLHVCNPRAQDMKTIVSQVQDHPWLYSKLKISPTYMKLSQTNQPPNLPTNQTKETKIWMG